MSRKAELEEWASRIRASVQGSGFGDWPDEHGVERLLGQFEKEVAKRIADAIVASAGGIETAGPLVMTADFIRSGDWRKLDLKGPCSYCRVSVVAKDDCGFSSPAHKACHWQEKANELTALLCDVVRARGTLGIPALERWWGKHEEQDRKRVEAEKRITETATARQKARSEALEKLTPEERILLGVK